MPYIITPYHRIFHVMCLNHITSSCAHDMSYLVLYFPKTLSYALLVSYDHSYLTILQYFMSFPAFHRFYCSFYVILYLLYFNLFVVIFLF